MGRSMQGCGLDARVRLRRDLAPNDAPNDISFASLVTRSRGLDVHKSTVFTTFGMLTDNTHDIKVNFEEAATTLQPLEINSLSRCSTERRTALSGGVAFLVRVSWRSHTSSDSKTAFQPFLEESHFLGRVFWGSHASSGLKTALSNPSWRSHASSGGFPRAPWSLVAQLPAT